MYVSVFFKEQNFYYTKIHRILFNKVHIYSNFNGIFFLFINGLSFSNLIEIYFLHYFTIKLEISKFTNLSLLPLLCAAPPFFKEWNMCFCTLPYIFLFCCLFLKSLKVNDISNFSYVSFYNIFKNQTRTQWDRGSLKIRELIIKKTSLRIGKSLTGHIIQI